MAIQKVKKIVFLFIWASLIILLKEYSLIDNHLGIGSMLLSIYFPAISLLKISARTHAVLALIFLSLTAVMTQIGLINEAKIFVIVTFGFLIIGITQNLVKHFYSLYEIN